MPKKLTTEEFISRARTIHNDLYDYSKVVYTYINNTVLIICKKHGEFRQKANNHLNNKNGCPKCLGGVKLNINSFVEKANKIHNNNYCYKLSIYVNSKTKIQIICKNGHDFYQTPHDHLAGGGCSKCSGKFSGNTEYFIERATLLHNNLYGYSNVIYKNNTIKVDIICFKNNHGTFKQTPHDHLDGHGCPKCVHTKSKIELEWLDYLEVPEKYRNKSIKLNNKLYKPDAVDLENKIIWEFYGDYYHGNPKLYQSYKVNEKNKKTFGELYKNTLEKEDILIQNGFRIVSMWENDWRNQRKLCLEK